ncbi:MAG: DUF3313 domain-containing protein [Oxalobacteraceae bacterium]|nr:MAG: DUF3313 domain-containing protein [Oxalobacteraceae bacterium]
MNSLALRCALPLGLALIVGACQTAPAADGGFLSSYEGLQTKEGTLRVSVRDRRDEALVSNIDRIVIEPAQLVEGATSAALSADDVAKVLGEVDRQVCYELSERFTILPVADADTSTVRVAVTRIVATEPVSSGAAAIANVFIPGPLGVRVPGTTGGLAAEAELLAIDGRQAAAVAFARSANVVGMDTPSLSRVGDALQFAEVFGDQVGDSFAPEDRPVRTIPSPDPCGRFGARSQPAGFLTRLVTGLYVPETEGVRPQ